MITSLIVLSSPDSPLFHCQLTPVAYISPIINFGPPGDVILRAWSAVASLTDCLGKTKLGSYALRELRIRLVEYRPFVILGGCICAFHQCLSRFQNVLKIGWLAGKTLAMFRGFLVFTPPKIGGIRQVRIRPLENSQGFFCRA